MTEKSKSHILWTGKRRADIPSFVPDLEAKGYKVTFVSTGKDALDSFIYTMAKFGFIDHGFYSAIIVLKWYGYLIQSCKFKTRVCGGRSVRPWICRSPKALMARL